MFNSKRHSYSFKYPVVSLQLLKNFFFSICNELKKSKIHLRKLNCTLFRLIQGL